MFGDIKKKDLKTQYIINLFNEIEKQSQNINDLLKCAEDAFKTSFDETQKNNILLKIKESQINDTTINHMVITLFGLFKMVGLQLRFCASANRIALYQVLIAKWIFKVIKKIQSYQKLIDEDTKHKLQSMLKIAVEINQKSVDQLRAFCLSELDSVSIDKEAVNLDSQIDTMYKQIKREMKSRIKSTNPKGIVGCYAILEIAKVIERISDYSIYNHFAIGYIATGENISIDVDGKEG
jgi:hypothetical protein